VRARLLCACLALAAAAPAAALLNAPSTVTAGRTLHVQRSRGDGPPLGARWERPYPQPGIRREKRRRPGAKARGR
jgi:hypothetical protein